MAPVSKTTIQNVNALKVALLRELDKGDDRDSDMCLDMLKRLDEVPVTLDVLSETLIGTAVSKFKQWDDGEVSAQAKHLVKKWKKLARECGIVSGATQPSSPSAAASLIQAPDASKPFSSSVALKAVARATTAIPASPPSSSVLTEQDFPPAWKVLPPFRRNVCTKLHEILTSSREVLSDLCESDQQDQLKQLSTSIEGSIFKFARSDKPAYATKSRQINFNLKKNSPLRSNLLHGDLSPSKLTQLSSEQLATTELSRNRRKLAKDLQESRRLDWDQANEAKINKMCGINGDLLKASLFTCGRCKSTKTTSTQKQTRSADEPMTVFVLCINCGNRWKC